MADVSNRNQVKKRCVKDVTDYFSKFGFSDNVVNKLQEDEIDGETLLLLTDLDIRKMGLKTGPTVKLRSLIQSLKELSCSANPETTYQLHSCVESHHQQSSDVMLSLPYTNNLDDFYVMNIMNANVVGEAIVKSFSARPNRYITHRERQDVVRIAVDHLNYGSLICEEFTRKYPTVNGFEQNFITKCKNRLPFLAKREGIDIPESVDECVRLILLTMKLNPAVTKVKKISFDDKKERVFLFRPKKNVNIYDVVENRPAEMNQPFLIVLGEETDTNLSFHLVIETKDNISRESSRAFQHLFAFFIVFNVKYPPHLNKFYAFFEEKVF